MGGRVEKGKKTKIYIQDNGIPVREREKKTRGGEKMRRKKKRKNEKEREVRVSEKKNRSIEK